MTYQVIVPPDIEREIAEIFDTFDSTDRALSFIEALNAVFDRIADRPLQFPIIHKLGAPRPAEAPRPLRVLPARRGAKASRDSRRPSPAA